MAEGGESNLSNVGASCKVPGTLWKQRLRRCIRWIRPQHKRELDNYWDYLMNRRTVVVQCALMIALAFAQRSGAQSAAASAARSDIQALAGCYRLTLGTWSIASRLGPPQPTAIVRLDTLPLSVGQANTFAAERLEPSAFVAPGDPRERWRRPASWRRVDADSLKIVAWSTGTEAEVFYGRRVGAELRGVLRRTSDAILMDPRTRRIQWDAWPWAYASGAPIPCP